MLYRFITCCIFLLSFLHSQDRSSSAPFISGDTFRAYADFIFDETNDFVPTEKMRYGSTVFVKTDMLSDFFTRIHPLIPCPYVLITHNSDLPIPGGFGAMLEDERILAWFGQNVEDFSHRKLHPLPIGIANRCWPHGNTTIFNEVIHNPHSKDRLLYMNFSIYTFYPERSQVYTLFKQWPYCFYSQPKHLHSYLMDLKSAHFVLCPRGNGLDTHRTWETLYMGSFPILRTSSSDALYEGLPVIIVRNWEEVTESFLEQACEALRKGEYAWEKLTAEYWFERIDRFKRERS